MATIDLLSIEPYKVSRDLRGYSVMVYGAYVLYKGAPNVVNLLKGVY